MSDFYRQLHDELFVSSIGLGTYLGEPTDADDAAYAQTLRDAVRAGINLIDTAINYRCQRSELAVGRALRDAVASGDVARDEIVVCTKGGYIPLAFEPPQSRAEYQAYVQREFLDPEILRPDDIVAGGHSLAPRFLRYCLAKSRQNLGLRTIDVYYLHNPGQQLGSVEPIELYERIDAAFAMLEEAVSRGEIGAYGVATWDSLRVGPEHPKHLSLERLVEAARRAGGDAHHFRMVQLPFNLAMPEAARLPTQTVSGQPRTALQAAGELGLDVVGSASLMQARLTSGLPPEIRHHLPAGASDAQAALEFARSASGLKASLVGMKSPEHLAENLGASRCQ